MRKSRIPLIKSLFFLLAAIAFNPSARADFLEISFEYDSALSTPLRILEIRRFPGSPPGVLRAGRMYSIQLIDERNHLEFETRFDPPIRLSSAPPLPGESPGEHLATVDQVRFALNIPWVGSRARSSIRDNRIRIGAADGTVLLEKAMPELPQKRFQSSLTSLIEPLESLRQPGPPPHTAGNQKLDVVFIGDGYGEAGMARFDQDAQTLAEAVLNFSPFKERSHQIVFRKARNTEDLDCRGDERTRRLLRCDWRRVTQQLNNSGMPYDRGIVIFNTGTYMGSYSDFAAVYNGSLSGPMLAHELGHSFGLHDEYFSHEGPPGGSPKTIGNCYRGPLPNPDWPMVSLDQYEMGCSYSNWYRSSPTSVMLTLTSQFFNDVSKAILNQRLDFFTR